MVPLKFFLILHRQVCPHPILSYHTFLLLLYFCCSFLQFFSKYVLTKHAKYYRIIKHVSVERPCLFH